MMVQAESYLGLQVSFSRNAISQYYPIDDDDDDFLSESTSFPFQPVLLEMSRLDLALQRERDEMAMRHGELMTELQVFLGRSCVKELNLINWHIPHSIMMWCDM